MNKIFIAGASGNIGKELTAFLLKKKKFELHCSYYKSRIFQKNTKNFYTYRINLVKNSSIKKLKRINPDLIINLAAFTNPAKNEVHPKKSFEKNVVINRNIVNYCYRYKKKLIFTSTDKVYGGNIKTPREKQDIKPDNIYGINKLKCEFEIKNKLKKYLILRYASVYSKKINAINNFINDQIRELKKRKKIYMATNVYRLFISAEYLCEIIFKLIKRDAVGTFNIGSTPSNYYNLMLSICKKNKIKVNKILFKKKIIAKPQYLIPSLKKINKYLKLKKTNPISI